VTDIARARPPDAERGAYADSAFFGALLDVWDRYRSSLAVCLVWHFFLLVPTLAFRHAYVSTIWYRDDPSSAAGAIASGPGAPLRLAATMRLAQGDVLVLAVAVAVLWLLGVRLAGLRPWRLAPVTVLLASLLGGANWLCLGETDRLLTPELASIAWYWVVEHPSVILGFHPYRVAALVAAAVVWALALRWSLRRVGGRPRTPLSLACAAAVSGVLIAGSLLLPRSFARTATPDAALVRRGFWLGTLAALRPIDPASVLGPATRTQVAAALRGATGIGAPPTPPAGVAADRLVPRHVVVIALETAPLAYYPLGADTTLRTFAAMTRHAIVAERHYATRPFSIEAMYSLLAGVYPAMSVPLEETPAVRTDGLAVVLAARGYQTTYVDAYKLDWRGGNRQRRLLTDGLGFQRIIEVERAVPMSASKPFRSRLAREREAFRAVLDRIDDASRDGRKALVVVASAIGHFDWPAPAEHRRRPAARKLRDLARTFDGLAAELLDGIEERGQGDSVLVVVTGDHGLRYGAEFASLGEPRRQADASFRVPFLLYAPGLLERTVPVPHVTSHVDLVPTVLGLLGVPADGLVLHGRGMLDPALADRTVFMLNSRLAPYDYVWHGGRMHELDHVSGGHPPAVRAAFDAARELGDLTTALFLRRAPAEHEKHRSGSGRRFDH
jgi:hypothetical protein